MSRQTESVGIKSRSNVTVALLVCITCPVPNVGQGELVMMFML